MKRLLPIVLMMAASAATGVVAQTTLEEARRQGQDMGKKTRADASLVPGQTQVDMVPGYQGTSLPEGAYFSDPDKLASEGAAQAARNDVFGTVTDRQRTRASFTNAEILATTKRATEIEQDPNRFLNGQEFGGSSGKCEPLPPSAGEKGYYEATCNTGTKIEEGLQTCTARMVPKVVNNARYFYWGSTNVSGLAPETSLQGQVSAGVCKAVGTTMHGCDAQIELGAGGTDVEGYRRFCKRNISATASLYSCSSELSGSTIGDHQNYKTGTLWYKKEGENSVTVSRQESGCDALNGGSCSAVQETCTEPEETRIIEGVAVTQSCWAWRREATCYSQTPASDCTDVENNRQCTFLRNECLDDPQEGDCKVSQKIYSCPLPDMGPPDPKQYVCGGDVYCINGNCETIEREASTEFKDALVGLHALSDAGKTFDPDKLNVFSGERSTCSKKIFGAANCCTGKGIPLLTPWLCSAAEKKLDERDDKGLCHKVGTYCSTKILGICVTSNDAYCCFGSKLSRILQVQGRIQLGKAWGKPKTEQCQGFTIEEFQRLDLSQMDFREIYAEFTEAARLPDEVQTMTDIQNKIEGYYDRHGRE